MIISEDEMISSVEAICVTSYEATTNPSSTCTCGTVPCGDMHLAVNVNCRRSDLDISLFAMDYCQFVYLLPLLIVWMNDLHPSNNLWIYSSLSLLPSSTPFETL